MTISWIKSNGRVRIRLSWRGGTTGAKNARGDYLECRRPRPVGGGGGRSQQPAKACMAGADRVAGGRRSGHPRDHAAERKEPERGQPLARAFPSRGHRWADARQDPALAHPAAARGGTRAHGGPDTTDPPGETTHWTATVMARAVGISGS